VTGFASIVIPQRPAAAFFPCRLRRHSSREPTKPYPAALHCVSALLGCGPIVPDLSDSHRGRDSRGPKHQERLCIMANIGSFTTTDNGFIGSIRTLTLNVKVRFIRIENHSDKGPHFRILAAGSVELGAAWQKVSEQTGRDYLSVKLDDPSFPAPIYATLSEVEGQDGLQLIWSRPTRD
jgi:uncharacterized protein (DUF736 family)